MVKADASNEVRAETPFAPWSSPSIRNGVFTNERDASRLILRKDLFELLEKAIDRCRDAGNVIYAIVLKNS